MKSILNSPKFAFAVAVVLVAVIAMWIAGCTRKTGGNSPDVGKRSAKLVVEYEVGTDPTVVAQVAEPGSVLADVYVAGRMQPVRATVRLVPGCWLVPKHEITMPGNPAGVGVVCNDDDDICEITQ